MDKTERLLRVLFPPCNSALALICGLLINKISDRLDVLMLPTYVVVGLALFAGVLVCLLDAVQPPIVGDMENPVSWRNRKMLTTVLSLSTIFIIFLLAIFSLAKRSSYIFSMFVYITLVLLFITLLLLPIKWLLQQINQYGESKSNDRVKPNKSSRRLLTSASFYSAVYLLLSWIKNRLIPSIKANLTQITVSVFFVLIGVFVILPISSYLTYQDNVAQAAERCSELDPIRLDNLSRVDILVGKADERYGAIVAGICSQLIDNLPDDRDLNLYYLGRANAHYLRGDLDEAIKDADRAIALQPDAAEAYLSRGRVRLALNNTKGAAEDYLQANLLSSPYDKATVVRILNGLGRIQARLGNYGEAIKEYNASLIALSQPLRGRGWYDLDSLLSRQRVINGIKESVAPYIFESRANAFYQTGKYELAIEDFYKASNFKETNYRNYEYYQDPQNLNYRDYELMLNIIDLEIALGESEELFRWYSYVIENLSCKSIETRIKDLNSWARDFDSSNEIEKQIDIGQGQFWTDNSYRNHDLIRFYVSNPEQVGITCSRAHYNRGKVRRDAWDNYGSIADYTRAIQLRPLFPESYRERGDIYLRMKRRDAALLDYEKSAEIFLQQNRTEEHAKLNETIQRVKTR